MAHSEKIFRIKAESFRKNFSFLLFFSPTCEPFDHATERFSINVESIKSIRLVACSLLEKILRDVKIVATEHLRFLMNQLVRFKVSDVAIPAPQEVVSALYGGDIVLGRVVDVTESGTERQAFIVVKVEAMKDVLILPVEKVIGMTDQ
jgi:hypothetical protein